MFQCAAHSHLIQVANVTSPHTEFGLATDTQYLAYVRAETGEGSSLPSVAQVFFTRSNDPLQVCSSGKPPLFHPNGHRYFCGAGVRPCPLNYKCIVSGSETNSYCCPTGLL
jgi:hypothetical protein